jgi:predicted amidohydrolase
LSKALRIAALQYCAGADAGATLTQIEPMIARAAEAGADLVALPEAASFLAPSRESLADLAENEADSPSLHHFSQMARHSGVWLLIGSLLIRRSEDGQLVNRSYLVAPNGKIGPHYDKIHMFDANVGDGRHYAESKNFLAGGKMVVANCGAASIGLSICYDVRFPALYRDLASAGAAILSVPSAFTYDSGRAHWHVLLRARAIENGCFVIAPAQCGTHADGRRTYGHALIISPWGEIMAEAETDDDVADPGANDDVIFADIDLDAVQRARHAIPSLSNARPYEV